MAALKLLRRLAGSFWVRALVSVGLLAAVATQIDFGLLRERLSGGSWGWFALAVVVLFASFVVGGLRWQIFLQAAGIDATPWASVRAYLIGTFTTNFLPTQIGGDLTRVFVVAGPGMRIRAGVTVVLDRASALACMLAVGWLLIALNPSPIPGQLYAAIASATAGFVLFTIVAVLLVRLGVMRRLVPDRARSHALEIRDALAACLTRPVLTKTLLIGLGFQGLVYLAAWLVARAISLDAPFAVIGAVMAPVLILSTAPVSIGGYGVREGSYVLLLGFAGVGATEATLFSLLSAATFALASLPGALVLLRRPRAAAPASARAPQPEDGEQERREEDLHADHEPSRRQQRDLALTERARAAGQPVDDDHDPADQADEEDRPADEQAMLEPEAVAHPLEERVVQTHEVEAVRAGDQPEGNNLHPDDDQE